MNPLEEIKTQLSTIFDAKHVASTLKYYSEAVEKHQGGDWESVSLKGGKFVESITKMLAVYSGVILPPQRSFKAGNILKGLEQLKSSSFSETVRIVIPKACLLIYEIVNNRGGRHAADDIDPNSMDTEVIMPTMSWILAELFRFSSKGTDPESAKAIIQSVTKRIYPHYEEIDGRPYINIKNLDGLSVALLILYYKYPTRILRRDLVEFVERHGFKSNTAKTSVYRVMGFVDDRDGNLKLRGTGIERVESILSKL
ncbi:hypothetical protein AUJ77_01710 [Candidatus Nomurabacteria bacterium CG1_02_43_90]|uniref:Uncharacterized protein n=1 Tax=Candidatus Nomurabacteria bacterium CG1_02_43_90 TaxID=1805281 RepID=A0A1J4V4D2_9BACT|nr:MAG: hypothetical protein AUJ77_01710 [Candidatus Nomurabacteria bacterium CG1_02_43_90]